MRVCVELLHLYSNHLQPAKIPVVDSSRHGTGNQTKRGAFQPQLPTIAQILAHGARVSSCTWRPPGIYMINIQSNAVIIMRDMIVLLTHWLRAHRYRWSETHAHCTSRRDHMTHPSLHSSSDTMIDVHSERSGPHSSSPSKHNDAGRRCMHVVPRAAPTGPAGAGGAAAGGSTTGGAAGPAEGGVGTGAGGTAGSTAAPSSGVGGTPAGAGDASGSDCNPGSREGAVPTGWAAPGLPYTTTADRVKSGVRAVNEDFMLQLPSGCFRLQAPA